MISMKVLHRSDAAFTTHYYAEQKDDYYSRDGNSTVWQGKGAAALGLSGEVDPERFKALIRGDFGFGIELAGTVRKDANARAGLDLTFSAPKSISLQALIAGDGRVIEAHDRAVTAALSYVESELAMGRLKVDGRSYAQRTGNLIIAKFRHETARPTKHSLPDPQLHTHAIIMNLTRRDDGSWVSLSNEDIVRLQKVIDAHYMSGLASGLERLGYDLRFEGNHVEIANYSRGQIEAFSKRFLDINRALHQLGVDRTTATRAQKSMAALQTRMGKVQEMDREQLQQHWRDFALTVGIDLESWKEHAHAHEHHAPELENEGQEDGRQPISGDDQSDGQAHEDDRSDPYEDGDRSWDPDEDGAWEIDYESHPETKGGEADSPAREPSGGRNALPTGQGEELPQRGDIEDQAGSQDQPGPTKSEPGAQPTYPSSAAGQQHPANRGGAEQVSHRTNFVATQAVRWAIKHLSEREAVFGESEVLASALRHSAGHATLPQLKRELQATVARGTLLAGEQTYSPAEDLKSRPLTRKAWIQTLTLLGHGAEDAARMVTEGIITGRLVAAEQQYTTARAHQLELETLQLEQAGRNALQPLMQKHSIEGALAKEPLTKGQAAAINLILSTQNRVIGVQGLAGTGKSHMLDRTRRILEQRGYKMIATASYGSQVRALRELGIEASTIASRLEATNKKRFSDTIDEKTVLVVDEAGVVPSRLMIKLMQLAQKTGARLVLLGDSGQTPAIEAGKPFAQMQRAGMATAGMHEIVRQKNPLLKAAVELAAAGKAKSALSRIEEIMEVRDDTERYKEIAVRYAGMTAAERSETLIVTGTNDSRNAINDACHEERGLAGKGRDYTLLTRRDTTQAERRYAKYYAVGDLIQPERDYACGLQRGELYRVTGAAERGQLRVEHIGTNDVVDFLPSRTQKLSVYQPVTTELSVGDWVRVTRNNAALDLTNGDRYEVVSVSSREVVIAGAGRRVSLPADAPLHLDRAYATTVHGAQGLTCDRVLINADAFSRTSKVDVFYVAISRARHAATIYTNALDKLPQAVARREEKSAALDLIPKKQYEQKIRPAELGLER